MSKASPGRQLPMAAGFNELEAFSRRLNSSLQLDVVCRVLADGVQELLGAQRCAIFLLDQLGGAASCVLARGLSAEYTAAVEATYRELPGGQLLQQRFLIVEDARTDQGMAPLRPLVESNGFVSMLLVALRHQETPLGAVAVYYDEQRRFDDALLALARTLANQAAIAIANAQSHWFAQRRVAELDQLRQAAVEINGQPNLPSTLQAIVRWGATLLDVQAASLYLYDAERQELEVRGICNVPQSHMGRRLKVGEGLSGRVFLTRQAELIGDYRSWEFASPVWRDITFATVLAVPLLYSDNPIGVLNFMDHAANRVLDDDAMRVAGLFASQAAAALTSALSLSESRRRADRLMALQRVTASVTAALNLGAVLQSVVEDLCSTFGYTLASIHRLQGDALVLEAVAGLAWQDVPVVVTSCSQGIIGRAARSAAAQYVTDVSTDADFIAVKPGVLAEAVMPIVLDGRVWGVLNVEASEWGILSAADVPLLDLFCQQIAVAIRNASNFAEIEQRVAELEGLRRTSLRLASSLNEDDIIQAIAAAVTELAQPQAMELHVFEQDSERLRLGAAGPAGKDTALEQPLPLFVELSAAAVEQRRPIIVDHTAGRPGHGADLDHPVPGAGLSSLAAFPLVRSSGVMGVFTIGYDQPTVISGALERFLSLFADQAAVALENARLYQLEARRRELADTLRQLASAVNSLMTFEEAATTILEYLARVVALDSTSILVMEDDRIRIAAHLVEEGVVWTETQVFRRGELYSADRVFHTGQPLMIPNTSESDLWNHDVGRRGIRSWLGFPIIFQGEPLGVLSIDRNWPGPFSAADIQMVKAFADQAATALASARLYQAVAQRSVENERLRKFNENLVRSVEAGILLERADDTIQHVNPRLCAIVGYREEELIGQSTAILLSPEMDALVDRKAASRRLGEKGRYEAALLHRAGHEIPVLVSATPLFEEGVFVGTLTAFTDITQRKRTERTLLALNAAAAAVRQAVEPQQVYETIGEEVRKLGLSLVVFSCDSDRQTLHAEHTTFVGHLREFWPEAETQIGENRFAIDLVSLPDFQRAIATGEAEFLAQPSQAASLIVVERAGIAPEVLSQALVQQRAVIAPVISQQQVTGVFLVLGHDLSEEDLPAFEAFANQTSAALDNARLFSAERRERLRAETLGRIAGILNSSLELDQALHQVMQQLRSLLSYDNSALFLMEGGQMVCRLADGVDADWWLGKSLSVDGYPLLQEMRATQQTILVPDTRLDSRWIGSPRTGHLASFIAAPLIADGQLAGMLSVDKAQHGFYSGENQELMAAFANQISVAMQRAWHLRDAQQRLRELSSLVQVSAALAEASDLAAVLDVVLYNTCELLGVERGAIALTKPPGRQLDVVAARGQPPGFIERVNQAGLCLPDIVEEDPCLRPPVLLGPAAELSQPPAMVTCIALRLAGQLIGLIEVDHSALDAPQQRLLMAVADLAAAAIDKAQLYQDTARAYQELRDLDRLKDEFVQNVSHELRTPLTFVKGYVEYLLEGYAGELNPGQRQALEIVLDRSDAIVRLVNDIVSLKQAELQAMDLQPVALEHIATACVEGSRVAAEQAGIGLQLDYPTDLPLVYVDATRLGQVFDNLLGNAIKFSPNGGSINVRLSPLGNMVQVEISDTGIGIPADRIDQIWKRFYQIDGASTRRFAGAGLGLAIVKSIIDAHFGHIWVESKLGQGSTFCFMLPQYSGVE